MNDECANCERGITTGNPYIADERTDAVWCSRSCFNDWADDNAEEIIAFYAKHYTHRL